MLRSLVRLACAASMCALILVAPAAQAAVLFDVNNELAAEEAVAMRHLPGWVQVVTSSATLFASDSGAKAASDKLPRYTFMRVLGGGDRRLQVELSTETGQAGQRGWIDPDDVLPSAAAQNWLVTAQTTPLYKGADAGAATLRALDRFSPLQMIDGPVQGRINVLVWRPDFQTVLETGWVEHAATGPAIAPASRVPDPLWGTAARKTTASDQQSVFLADAAQAARSASARTGVPASVTVAQAILESDWGRSLLAQSASNYFGVKAVGGLGNDGVVWMSTGEYDAEGQAYETMSPFRAYRSLTDSLVDHDLMLRNGTRYASAMQVAHDPRQFAQLLAEAGYATDPAYADKLIALMDRYDLYRLDA